MRIVSRPAAPRSSTLLTGIPRVPEQTPGSPIGRTLTANRPLNSRICPGDRCKDIPWKDIERYVLRFDAGDRVSLRPVLDLFGDEFQVYEVLSDDPTLARVVFDVEIQKQSPFMRFTPSMLSSKAELHHSAVFPNGALTGTARGSAGCSGEARSAGKRGKEAEWRWEENGRARPGDKTRSSLTIRTCCCHGAASAFPFLTRPTTSFALPRRSARLYFTPGIVPCHSPFFYRRSSRTPRIRGRSEL
ncbi:hypothetical protein KM043_002908 [Ampulex compressa]|nr:hypothetical protein KM043_002908 [Ampulex compressa]